MSVKTAVVIVMYNHWCGDANTCTTILKNTVKPDLVLVVDNSTKEMNNRSYCEEHGWLYHSMQGNAGLSKAYNAALEILKGKTDIVVWADDDTDFSVEYFEKLAEYTNNFKNDDIFLPVIKGKSFYLSPCIFTRRRVLPIYSLEELENKEITGINSGMAVRFSVYENYRYDELIFLDYLDHDFLRWCRMNGKSIKVMADIELFQNFFAEGNSTAAARKHRNKIFRKDIKYFEYKCGKNRILTEYDLFLNSYRQWLARIITKIKRFI